MQQTSRSFCRCLISSRGIAPANAPGAWVHCIAGFAGAVLALLSSLSVQAASPPKGWQYQPQSGFVSYSPANLGERTFMVIALNPMPTGGQSIAVWGEALAGRLSQGYGQITRREVASHTPPVWSVTHHLKGNNGQTLFATYTARIGKDEQARLVLMLGEPGLIATYGSVATKLSAEILTEDPEARTRLARPRLAERGHTGVQFGGDFSFGRYLCQVGNGRYPFDVELELYPNLEYRSDRRDHATGSFRYDPGNASFDLEADYHLLDYQLFEHDENSGIVSVYFRDASGKPWIYGEDLSDGEATLCEYQGEVNKPSPSVEAAAKAEERRFKWVTAPGQGVAEEEIEAILHQAEHKNDSLGIRLEEDHILLLKDGWAYMNLRVPPADLDVRASRDNEPNQWRRWRRHKGAYQLERADAWQDAPGLAVRPARPGETLSGAYSHASMYGNLYTTAHTFKDTLYFRADGTLSQGSSVRGGTTAMNSGNFSANVARDEQDHRPVRYQFDGYTLIRHYPDGSSTRSLTFFWGEGQKHLSINGTTYSLE